jgi:microcin C transport system substrate-binding protein
MGRICRFGAALACLVVLGGPVASASDSLTKHHALSLIGTPKYGPDFTHFDWVNPNAPKGGRVRRWAMGTFDSLNQFPVKGAPATGLGLIYDTLLMQSPDEAGAAYGLVAEWVAYPED